MITHPKGAVLEALARAGLAPSQLHGVADEIVAAYADANAGDLELEAEVTSSWPAQTAGESAGGQP